MTSVRIHGCSFDLSEAERLLSPGDTVLVQSPQGLRRGLGPLVERIEAIGAEAVLDAAPSFGACDLALATANSVGADVLLHVGHARIPGLDPPADGPRVVFVPGRLEEVAGSWSIPEVRGRRVALALTAQTAHLADRLKRAVRSAGGVPLIAPPGPRGVFPGQVLGCDLGPVSDGVGADLVLVLSDGRFYAMGALLATTVPVFALDPVTGSVEDLTPERDRFLRRRFGLIAIAREAASWGVVWGTLPGQSRPGLARRIARLARERGKAVRLLVADILTPERLSDFGVGCCVSTLCPRVALDDRDYGVPVLTPFEARVALGDAPWHRYGMDAMGPIDSSMA